MKCSDCGTEVKKKGLCSICKSKYNKKWYQRNKKDQLLRIQKNNKRYKVQAKELIKALKDVPCADCKGKFPTCAMDFDHLGKEPKKMNIGTMVGQRRTTSALKKEIAKCEVVCANCHRIRTEKRRLS